MNTDTFQTVEIPLNKLLAWNHNVRTDGAEEGIDELAASIASVGLLQGLVVKKEPRGKYAVIAGRRRLLALSRLAGEGTFKTTLPIPCRVAPDDADLPEISLTENVVRAPMSPVDELKSFGYLVENGKCIAAIAARFGVTEAVVSRRLALARVSPVLLEEYRSGRINLELLQAFTLTDDHNIQETVWSELPPWDRNARTIRQMLSGDSVPATEKRVRFVGLSAYEQAGGTVRRDLFAEGEFGTFVEDPAKLNRLVSEKLQAIGEGATAEGWKWVEAQPELNHQSLSRFKRIPARALPLPAEVQAELSALEQRRDGLVQQLEDGDGDEDVDQQPLYDQIDEIEDRIQEIQLTQKRAYPEEVKAACGVVISVGQNGEPEFLYGLLRKEDEAALANSELRSGDPPPAETAEAANEAPAYSAALVESLTQHKTAAIAVELTAQPAIALAALVYARSLSEFGLDLHLYRAKSAVQVSTCRSHLERATGSPAFAKLEEQRQNRLRKLPGNSVQLWRFCLELDQITLLQLMAYCLARSVNGVQSKNASDRERLEHTDALATALQVDMAKWFTPTAENFFGRISKPRIALALAEAGKPASAITLAFKKADLATVAEKEIQGTGWLPEPVRILEGIRETSPTSAA